MTLKVLMDGWMCILLCLSHAQHCYNLDWNSVNFTETQNLETNLPEICQLCNEELHVLNV